MNAIDRLCTLIAEQNELLFEQKELLRRIATKYCTDVGEVAAQVDNFEGTYSGRWLYARAMESNHDGAALGLSVSR